MVLDYYPEIGSSVDIIEVLSEGKYKLNERELQSIVSKAENCDNFALISIVGPKLSGKTLFLRAADARAARNCGRGRGR